MESVGGHREPEYSINTEKAEGLGYRFSVLRDWIYELLDFYIEQVPLKKFVTSQLLFLLGGVPAPAPSSLCSTGSFIKRALQICQTGEWFSFYSLLCGIYRRFPKRRRKMQKSRPPFSHNGLCG